MGALQELLQAITTKNNKETGKRFWGVNMTAIIVSSDEWFTVSELSADRTGGNNAVEYFSLWWWCVWFVNTYLLLGLEVEVDNAVCLFVLLGRIVLFDNAIVPGNTLEWIILTSIVLKSIWFHLAYSVIAYIEWMSCLRTTRYIFACKHNIFVTTRRRMTLHFRIEDVIE